MFEPHVGGRLFERTPAGDEHAWGEITAWEPPQRLGYLWHLREDPADATDVEITFGAAADGDTRSIEHGGWERLGERGSGLASATSRLVGLLPHFEEAAESRRSVP